MKGGTTMESSYTRLEINEYCYKNISIIKFLIDYAGLEETILSDGVLYYSSLEVDRSN